MANDQTLESVVAVDCGDVFTKAALIDLVEGRYRLIARGEAFSTHRMPHMNIVTGVTRAIAQIERRTGRRLLDQHAQLIFPERGDGSGIDAFVLTADAGRPLRLFLAGLTNEASLASARAAAQQGFALVADSISLEDGLDRPEGIESALARFEQAEADAIILAGGVDGGASTRLLDIASTLALALRMSGSSTRPPVIYAGNQALSDSITAIFGELTDVRVVDNVRPSIDVQNLAPLAAELQKLYVERKLNRLPGMGGVAGWSRVPILPSTQAKCYTLSYLASQRYRRVISVEVGASQTTISWAMDGQANFVTRHGWGTMAGEQVVREAGLSHLLRWVPESCEPDEAAEIIQNLILYPGVAPGSRREVDLAQAMARVMAFPLIEQARRHWYSKAWDEVPPWDAILLGGTLLTRTLSPGRAALFALDVLQPVGISTLLSDSVSLAAPLGALAALEPLAAAHVADSSAFVNLGTLVALAGSAKTGDIALRVRVAYADGRSLRLEVPCGSLDVIPLGPGEKAILELRPGRRFGLGPAHDRRKLTIEVMGGALGIVVDARGRPLPSVEDLPAAQARMQQWMWDVGA